jgi:hypothetical protein
LRGVPMELVFEPYAKGYQHVMLTNLNTGLIRRLKHDRCPRELRCY